MDIVVEQAGAVLTIEFNRPHKKNAFTGAMYSAIVAALAHAEVEPSVRVILFKGKQDVFTSGNDLDDFAKNPPTSEDSPAFHFVEQISKASKPLVAAVTGPAIGLGTTMLLHCDLVYAGENARFGLPFTRLGLVPEAGSTYLLPLIAGYHRAAELALLAQTFGPAKAKQAGFVTEVLAVADTLPAAQAAAKDLAALPAKSVQTTKALLKLAHAAVLEAQRRREGEAFRRMLGEPAAAEAFRAFAEKRQADFSKCH